VDRSVKEPLRCRDRSEYTAGDAQRDPAELTPDLRRCDLVRNRRNAEASLVQDTALLIGGELDAEYERRLARICIH
jgi:hypothetical protein